MSRANPSPRVPWNAPAPETSPIQAFARRCRIAVEKRPPMRDGRGEMDDPARSALPPRGPLPWERPAEPPASKLCRAYLKEWRAILRRQRNRRPA